jgi:hypothetical protein
MVDRVRAEHISLLAWCRGPQRRLGCRVFPSAARRRPTSRSLEAARCARTEKNLTTGEITLDRDYDPRSETSFTPSLGIAYRATDAIWYETTERSTIEELEPPYLVRGGIQLEL